jgi:hypothetical protein
MSIEATSKAISGLITWVNNMRMEEMRDPSAGSAAARDEANAFDGVHRERLVNARRYAAVRIIGARSCLHAVQACFELPDPAPPCHTLCRSVIENSARAHWLIIPELDVVERVARSASDQLHGLTEKRKLARTDAEWAAAMNERIGRLKEQLGESGIVPTQHPTGTSVTAGLLGGGAAEVEIIYRLFSATPHGGSHSIFTNTIHFGIYVEPARIATLGLTIAFDNFTRYMGWGGRPAFRQWAGRTLQQLKKPDPDDYWVSNE